MESHVVREAQRYHSPVGMPDPRETGKRLAEVIMIEAKGQLDRRFKAQGSDSNRFPSGVIPEQSAFSHSV